MKRRGGIGLRQWWDEEQAILAPSLLFFFFFKSLMKCKTSCGDFFLPKVSNHISSAITAFASSVYPLSVHSCALIFPPLSSLYYLRHTNPLFHPSFSSPFRWRLNSHLFWQWHIAAVCRHIPSTQHNVLTDSPRVRLPLHLSLPLFIHPASTSSRWPPPSLPLRSILLLVCIILSAFLSLGSYPAWKLLYCSLYWL